MYTFIYYFMIFLIYSVIGYICEITSVSLVEKKVVLSRGYLIGPIIPIFGFGGLIITLFLEKYASSPITTFIVGMFDCCLLEYMTSYLMEKIYGLRWWDYSNKKFNVNGRICLETGVLFGIGSIIIIDFLNPVIFSLLNKIPKNLLIIIGFIFLTTVIADFVISTKIIVELKIDTKKYANTDATKEIRDQVIASIKKHSYFYNRVIKAFPHMKYDDRIKKVVSSLKSYRELRRKQNEK